MLSSLLYETIVYLHTLQCLVLYSLFCPIALLNEIFLCFALPDIEGGVPETHSLGASLRPEAAGLCPAITFPMVVLAFSICLHQVLFACHIVNVIFSLLNKILLKNSPFFSLR